jgi:hypothetical protein
MLTSLLAMLTSLRSILRSRLACFSTSERREAMNRIDPITVLLAVFMFVAMLAECIHHRDYDSIE